MDDKMMHSVQLAMLLLTACVLIIFAHNYISPEIVFTGLIGGIGGIVGTRIASNGYVSKPATTSPTTSQGPSINMQDTIKTPAIPQGG